MDAYPFGALVRRKALQRLIVPVMLSLMIGCFTVLPFFTTHTSTAHAAGGHLGARIQRRAVRRVAP